MAKGLTELQADLQAVNREREALRSKAKKLTAKIDPLLEQAEVERRANPGTEGEAQSVG